MNSLDHLRQHHGDFANFRDIMIQTAPGRFSPLWWGFWDQHIAPSTAATIVDLGTGPGTLLVQLRERMPEARLYGVEVQPEMLPVARASAEASGATLIEADLAEALPLQDGVADVVTAVMVFHELAFPPPMLDEVFRLLKPGGKLVLWDWAKTPLANYLGQDPLTRDKLDHFREHCLFSGDDLVFLCERAGFQVIERVDRRSGNFAMIAAVKPA